MQCLSARSVLCCPGFDLPKVSDVKFWPSLRLDTLRGGHIPALQAHYSNRQEKFSSVRYALWDAEEQEICKALSVLPYMVSR